MKVKELINRLDAFITNDPKTLELDIVLSRDAEGNGYLPAGNFLEIGMLFD